MLKPAFRLNWCAPHRASLYRPLNVTSPTPLERVVNFAPLASTWSISFSSQGSISMTVRSLLTPYITLSICMFMVMLSGAIM